MQRHNTTTVVVQHVENGRTIGWLQWSNIAGSLYKEEEAAEKDDYNDYYWTGVQENIGMYSKL